MKKIKIICLLLALVMLLSSCSIFNSNKPEDPPSGDEPPTEEGNDFSKIKVEDYKMVYARSFSDMLHAKLIGFQDSVQDKTGTFLMASTDRDKNGYESTTLEILLGPTSRVESAAALEKLNGRTGYVVAQIGTKVVINGTSDYMVEQAWNYFEKQFVNRAEADSGVIPFEEGYVYTNTDIATKALSGTSVSGLSVVYDANLDTNEKNDYGATGASHVAYLYRQAQLFAPKMAKLSGKAEDSISLVDDAADFTSGIEVLFGKTNRQISTELLGTLSVNEYGVLCKDRQLALGGWSDEMVVNATNYLTLLFDYCTDYNTGVVRFPTDVVFRTNRTEYPDGVPQFEGGTLVGVIESGSGTLEKDVKSSTFQECYSGCTLQQYNAYLSTLRNAGFVVYYESENANTDTNASNRFTTLTNQSTVVHVYYIGERGIVRVVISRSDNVILPNVAKENYTKLTEPKLTQMRFAYDTGNFGLCTILTLEDGSFIIYDGGGEGKDGKVADDHVRLYNLLSQLNTRSDGKIVIAAWILTHQHWDHYYNFYKFCQSYGKKNVEIEQYICNLSSSSYKYNSHNPDGYGITSLIKVRDEFMKTPFDIVEVHTGQNVWVRNVRVEILFTQEDMYPSPIYYFNNTTLVTRLHVYRTTAAVNAAVTANTTTSSVNSILMLGDQNHEASHYMLDMYGKVVKATATLKSDIVQVAHHGVNGVISEVYNVADPTLLLWPTSQKNYDSWTNGKAGGNTVCHYEGCLGDDGVKGNDDGKHSYKIINKRLRDKIDSGALEVIIADHYNWTFTFPWAPGHSIGYTDDLGVTGNGTYTPR